MNADKLKQLQIASAEKKRPRSSLLLIFLGVLFASLAAAFFAWPRAEDQRRVKNTGVNPPTNSAPVAASTPGASPTSTSAAVPGQSALTVSGYIVNRERIELSPRFLGVVKWIGVRKGDAVTNGQVVVLLDDAEYQARLKEVEGRVAAAHAGVAKAELDAERMNQLARTDIESKKAQDDARLQLDS